MLPFRSKNGAAVAERMTGTIFGPARDGHHGIVALPGHRRHGPGGDRSSGVGAPASRHSIRAGLPSTSINRCNKEPEVSTQPRSTAVRLRRMLSGATSAARLSWREHVNRAGGPLTERDDALRVLQSSAETVLGREAPVLAEAQTLEDAAIDSLDLVEIIMVVEEEEGYTIDAADLEGVSSVSEVVDLLLTKRGGR